MTKATTIVVALCLMVGDVVFPAPRPSLPIGSAIAGTGPPGFVPLVPSGAAAHAATDLTLAWDAPVEGNPTSYIVEAGSAPGLSDIASFGTGSADTFLFLPSVPSGIYYVRVRASNVNGVSEPSNEITVGVDQVVSVEMESCVPPPPPVGLTSAIRGLAVTVSWAGSPDATSYVIEAGSAPGASDVYVGDIGNLTTVRATVAPGIYFIRVRGKSHCGIGAPSGQIAITIRAP